MKMRKILAALIIALVATSSLVIAGPGHSHSHGPAKKLNDTEAIAVADKAVNQLVELKRPIEGAALDADWLNIPDEQKKVFKKGKGYYIISFTKTDAEKKLYVLLSDSGTVYDANYSGKFEGLKDES